MKPGELRRFTVGPFTLGDPAKRVEESTFMVLRVGELAEGPTRYCVVDILLDGMQETNLGYFWVKDSSEAVDAAG